MVVGNGFKFVVGQQIDAGVTDMGNIEPPTEDESYRERCPTVAEGFGVVNGFVGG